MQRSLGVLGGLLCCGLLVLANAGCLKQMILDGQLASTRKASAAATTIGDWEIAQKATFAGLAQFEGMHYLAPENMDGLFLLTKGWAGAAFGFIEDEMERAADEHGDMSPQVEYQKARAVAAYSRAIYYGTQALDMMNPGFEQAKRNAKTLRAWLEGFDDPEEHTPFLFWTGQAWLGKTGLLRDQPAAVSELFVGYEIIKRAVELDETYLDGSGHVMLGAYHARSRMAELDESKKHFERALQINGGKALLTKFQYATRYYCAKMDQESYVRLLEEVLQAGDVLPKARLNNAIAKRRAKRHLRPERMELCGFE